MLLAFQRREKRRAFLASLMIIFFVLSSCARQTPTQTVIPTTEAPTPTASTSTPLALNTLTATPTLLAAQESASSGFGLIVFSMGDGRYTHLFIYDPYSLPITRLTAGNWDDEDPAISPDGKQIAFSSNRDGQWDIYILNVSLDEVLRVTQSKTYDGSPTWSPDGQNIVYQTMNGKNIDLVIQPVADLSSTPIQITDNSGDNFDASWSPDGKQIAFTTNRNGKDQIWLFNLKSTEDRFSVIAASDEAYYVDARWSPDGTNLAWCKKDNEDHIESISITDPSAAPKTIGIGCSPTWSPDGTSILANFQQANSQYFVAYNFSDATLSLPLIQTSSQVQSSAWVDETTAKYLLNFVNLQSLPETETLYTPALSLPKSETGRNGVVELKNVNVPNPYLSDTADEAFSALRSAFGKKVGWDFLATLDNAYLPLTATTYPNLIENWLYSGRAFAISSGALSAGWIVVTREDFNGNTYWRIWVKCLDQTGSCGKPILSHTWDFSSRSTGDLQAYEAGGKIDGIPNGYWVDFTEFASRYGWERQPAQTNWRYYYQGALYDHFVFRQGLTWRQAMLQLYPTEAVDLLDTGN